MVDLLRAAGRVLALVGLYQGDFLPDRFNREMPATEYPHSIHPMTIVAALAVLYAAADVAEVAA